jgi:hypothetical protein
MDKEKRCEVKKTDSCKYAVICTWNQVLTRKRRKGMKIGAEPVRLEKKDTVCLGKGS